MTSVKGNKQCFEKSISSFSVEILSFEKHISSDRVDISQSEENLFITIFLQIRM